MATNTSTKERIFAETKFTNPGGFLFKAPNSSLLARDTCYLPNFQKPQTKVNFPFVQRNLYSSILNQWLMRSLIEGIHVPENHIPGGSQFPTTAEKPNYLLQDLNVRYKELLINRFSFPPANLKGAGQATLFPPFYPNTFSFLPQYQQMLGVPIQTVKNNSNNTIAPEQNELFVEKSKMRNCFGKSQQYEVHEDNKLSQNSTDSSSIGKERKSHKCIYCGKLYSRKYGLKIHIRTHTGYKPLKCKVCGRPFGDPSNLNKHVRLHAEGETPYRCKFCGKVLVRRRDLDRHIKSRHSAFDSNKEEILYPRESWKI